MSKRRVVVTGIGLKTPVGSSISDFWNNLVAGKSGIGRITHFDASQFRSQIAGEVDDFDPLAYFDTPKDARKCDRFAQLGFAAAKDAYRDSGLTSGDVDPLRASVIFGSGIGGLRTLEEQYAVFLEKGPRRLSPLMIPMMISNIAAGIISIEFNFQGPNFAIVTACATSAQSIGASIQHILNGEVDVVLTGGSEAAVSHLGVGGFSAMRAISTRNDEPEKASRPFDKDRDGFILSEGAGALVLEELEHARKRGAKIYAEMIGYGASADAHHITDPPPGGYGAANAMKRALQEAQLNPDQIDYVNAHGTSTPAGDVAETLAIKSVFGEAAKKVWISSTKSMIGHLLGASGAVELAASIQSLQTGVVHPTINLETPDPQCDLDYVPNEAREGQINTIMSNSFGFGGHNACLIARKLA